jgi:two-component system KDP operon response regulator KdpE
MMNYELAADINSPARILVIEDDINMRRIIRIALEVQGYRVSQAATASDGLKQAELTKPDVIVLDLGLPDFDGMDLLPELHSKSAVPVIVLSGRSLPSDKIAALDAGSDDYMIKPFDSGELLARVRARLRRPIPEIEDAVVKFGEVCVDFARRIVTRKGEKVNLTPTEFRLLRVLLRNADKMLSKRQLMIEVWGPGNTDNSHYLRTYIVRLRTKLEQIPVQPQHILTETGMGYRFVF